jgi:hypothetical protein
METPDLLNQQRVAAASIRGYYYQFLCTFERWLLLKDNEAIWCEGNEDIDRRLSNGAISEEQVKHLAGKLTDSSSSITSTLLNFAQGYVHNHKKGYHSFHIFRTTAELGSLKNQELEAWLRQGLTEESDKVKLIETINAIAKQKLDNTATEAIAYIEGNNLVAQFLLSCSWGFEKLDYQDMFSKLTEDVQLDSRCKGIDPNLVVRSAISKIAESSSCNELTKRCLTRYDFNCLVNDIHISKVASQYGNRASSGERVIAVTNDNEYTVAITLRFDNVQRTRDIITEKSERVRAHPDYSGENDLSSILKSDLFLDSLRQLDFDAFIVYGCVNSARRLRVKHRWLARRALSMSNYRDIKGSQIFMEESLQKELSTMFVTTEVRVEPQDDPLLCLANIVAEWVIEQIGDYRCDHPITRIYRKVRCVCKWDLHEFSTQEDPAEDWFAT